MIVACSSSDNCRTTFPGEPSDERAGRDLFSRRHQGVRADDGTRADFRAVENDRAHADEHFVVDRAGVDDRAVADRDQFADDRRIIVGEMDDGAVLNIGARADDDAVNVAAQNGAIPDARFFAERDVANDGGVGNNKRARMQTRTETKAFGEAGVSGGKWVGRNSQSGAAFRARGRVSASRKAGGIQNRRMTFLSEMSCRDHFVMFPRRHVLPFKSLFSLSRSPLRRPLCVAASRRLRNRLVVARA